MRFSTPLLYAIIASTAMASTDASVSYSTPSSRAISVPSSSSSAIVIDPNDPVQKSIWSILGKVASGILGIFGGNSNSHKIKRDIDALISATTTTTADTGSSSNSESSVSVDLSDPVQKAIWGNIGKTVLGSITKRDVDNLTDEQRKSLRLFGGFFGLGPIVNNFKRDVTKVELDQLVAELAAAASSAATAPSVSATVVSSLI
ncbi:unnamed protein product [Ambrosiozyma monospora]|uniref:Unnamed protein product n=1 Tax=Ambrosiozyma monospora TaxID=43982 RepID=A0A9W6YU35_AMBMO|nr:unnamed protein product [Ambrosiozyma monospora]